MMLRGLFTRATLHDYPIKNVLAYAASLHGTFIYGNPYQAHILEVARRRWKDLNQMLEKPGEMKPESGKPSTSGRWVFFATLGIFAAIVAAVILTANDMRNLRILMDKAGIAFYLPPENPPVPQQRPEIYIGQKIVLSPSMTRMAEAELASTFMRMYYRNGISFCEVMAAEGAANEGWKQSPYDSQTFECTSEIIKPTDGDAGARSSFFMVMKGNEDGVVDHVRSKIVTDDEASAGEMRNLLVRFAELFISTTNWKDFETALGDIRRFKPVSAESFGASLSFTKEFTREGRYNLIFALKAKTKSQKRTSQYFDPANWLALPQELITEPETFLMPVKGPFPVQPVQEDVENPETTAEPKENTNIRE